MKATYHATHRGPGGLQHIELEGDLVVEGLPSSSVDLSHVETKLKTLEGVLSALHVQVQTLQAQLLEKQTAMEVESLKTATTSVGVAVVEPVIEEPVVAAPASTTSSKKKSATV